MEQFDFKLGTKTRKTFSVAHGFDNPRPQHRPSLVNRLKFHASPPPPLPANDRWIALST